jgi:peptidoglycan/xylan/chitin deacetylase (PgdA/CDA1 family)
MTMLVALTFDAEHPDQRRCHPGNAAAVLDLLAGEGVDATFFVQGRWAEAYPELLRQIVQGGHLVGNHSYYHARMPLLTKQGLRLDVTQAQKTLVALAGIETRPWFRSPFGATDGCGGGFSGSGIGTSAGTSTGPIGFRSSTLGRCLVGLPRS